MAEQRNDTGEQPNDTKKQYYGFYYENNDPTNFDNLKIFKLSKRSTSISNITITFKYNGASCVAKELKQKPSQDATDITEAAIFHIERFGNRHEADAVKMQQYNNWMREMRVILIQVDEDNVSNGRHGPNVTRSNSQHSRREEGMHIPRRAAPDNNGPVGAIQNRPSFSLLDCCCGLGSVDVIGD